MEAKLRLDAITCCVGQYYCDLLSNSLPVWLPFLDSLTIVTRPNDPATQFYGPKTNICATDLFGMYGAHFNKGAALCQGYGLMQPRDWVLHFDADILPPDDWYDRMLERLEFGCLHATRRYSESGEPLDEQEFWPYGFFQLWHSCDPAAIRWPLFEPWHAHAGNYDAEFAEYWPKSKWVDLGFPVTHFGEPRVNWFGPEGDPSLMDPIKAEQIHVNRINARKPENRLAVPSPHTRLTLDRKTPEFAAAVVRLCAQSGPFEIEARIGDHNAVEHLA